METRSRRNYDDEIRYEDGADNSIQKVINIGKAVASLLLFIASGVVVYFNIILEMNDMKNVQNKMSTVVTLEQKHMLKEQQFMTNELRYLKNKIDVHEKDIFINMQHRIAADERHKIENLQNKN